MFNIDDIYNIFPVRRLYIVKCNENMCYGREGNDNLTHTKHKEIFIWIWLWQSDP